MLTRSPICCPTFSSVRPICGGIFDFDTRSNRLAAVERELENPKIWEDQKRAQELGKEKKQLDGVVGTLIELDGRLKDSTELFELARGEEDDATLDAVASDAAALQRTVGDLEFRRMFHDPMDPNPCFIDIQAGSGGTEAQDWASMLLRMYVRYCERKGYQVDVLEESAGQHINKTDSAVRITHLPTNIVVQCQNDRSQHRNRAEAMAMLKSRLYDLELRKRQAEQQKLEDAKTDIGWGHQIRSYVLDQSRIKDLRTNYEVGNTQAVLDGGLDDFIAASLKQGV